MPNKCVVRPVEAKVQTTSLLSALSLPTASLSRTHTHTLHYITINYIIITITIAGYSLSPYTLSGFKIPPWNRGGAHKLFLKSKECGSLSFFLSVVLILSDSR
jgi:hypothetical protein